MESARRFRGEAAGRAAALWMGTDNGVSYSEKNSGKERVTGLARCLSGPRPPRDHLGQPLRRGGCFDSPARAGMSNYFLFAGAFAAVLAGAFVLAAGFFAAVLAAGFFAAVLAAAGFFAAVLVAAGFFAAVLAAGFFAAGFFAGAFLAAGFVAVLANVFLLSMEPQSESGLAAIF